MKKTKVIVSLLTVSAITGAVFALPVGAETEENKVHIVIENNTLSEEAGAAWSGVLVDEWVEINDDSTASGILIDTLSSKGLTQSGAEYDYITEINGLSGEDGGSMGSWMFTLDDWFTDEGISAYTVSSGKLENGDEIRFMFSCAWGADLGYDWSGADTSLSGVDISGGKLTSEFSPETKEYTLEVSDDNVITVYPHAANKAYRTKVYKNNYTPAEAGTDVKFGQEIVVEDGDTIIIGVANSAWMQYNYNGAEESIYTITVNVEVPDIDVAVQEAESFIAAIGTVTESSGEAIRQARNFYDSLTPEQQSKVSNYDVLLQAEEDYAKLEKSTIFTIDQMRAAYNELFPETAVFGNEWDVINFSRFGLMTDDIASGYILSVKDALDTIGSSKLSKTRSTVNSGVAAALTSAGADPTDFYGYNLLEPLADFEYVNAQGVNGSVYALIAFDLHDFEIPTSDEAAVQTTRELLIDDILSSQYEDGGWTIDTWSGTDDGSDADMTAMALQALAPYYNSNERVKTAIDKALLFLSENQNEEGAFRSYGSYDCESCAQVLSALCSLGIDIDTDERFIKNGKTVYDALLSFCDKESFEFSHFIGSETSYISTYQAYSALAAYYRSVNEMSALFDMNDVALTVYRTEETSEESSETSTEESSEDVSKDASEESSEEKSGTVTDNSESKENSESKDNSESNGTTVSTTESSVSDNGSKSSVSSVSKISGNTAISTSVNTVNTGDNSVLWIVLALMFVSCTAMKVFARFRKE